jgi:hypothetical protein
MESETDYFDQHTIQMDGMAVIRTIVPDCYCEGCERNRQTAFMKHCTIVDRFAANVARHYVLEKHARRLEWLADSALSELVDLQNAGRLTDSDITRVVQQLQVGAHYKTFTEDKDMNTLRNVEIFAAGQWNGDTYTPDDLDEMCAAFSRLGFRPPVTLGHVDKPGSPAVGWVANLRRVGSKLLADFEHVPSEIYQAIKRRAFDRVSAEIFWNMKAGDKKFRRALKAVALLGADVPAVTSLAPLHTLFAGHTGEVRQYEYNLNRSENEEDMQKDLMKMSVDKAMQAAGDIIDSKVRLLQQSDPGLGYNAAYMQVKQDPENRFLVELYSGQRAMRENEVANLTQQHRNTRKHADEPFSTAEGEKRAAVRMSPEQCGEFLSERAQEIKDATPGLSLTEAMIRARKAHPEIAQKYSEMLGVPEKYRDAGA